MGSDTRDLLVEIGTEELPSSELEELGRAFAVNLSQILEETGLSHGDVTRFATPRRLAVKISALATTQDDEVVEHRGPPVRAAFDDDGKPTRAAEGFARTHGVTVAELERRDTGKAEYLFHTEQRHGRDATQLLPGLIAEVLRKLPARKRMRWGVPDVSFPRPVHWAVVLFGEESIHAEPLGVTSSRNTRGHRFHHPDEIELASPDDYERILFERGHVIASLDERRDRIREQVEAAAREAGGAADLDEELLTEVASLVEWPVPVTGRFDTRFLDVPPEALVAVMKDHQKYFPVYAANGSLLPVFITISNIDSADPEMVRQGNERVIAPRLADAEFFWNQDRKIDANTLNRGLATMTYHPKLGSVGDRVSRIEIVVTELADLFRRGSRSSSPVSPKIATAARFAKFDLLTQMVGEFPELQGIMGGYYLRESGYPQPVWQAVREHYRPAFAGDDIPATAEGRLLALADRLDALVGLFAIGQPPTGDKDPFALRRSALGALRIIIEGELDLDLEEALQRTAASYPPELQAAEAVPAVFDFMMDRLRVYYADRGIAHDSFTAVLARRPPRPTDFDARLQALQAFRARPESGPLAEANKRIHNILRKADSVADEPDPAILTDAAEAELLQRADAVRTELEPMIDRRDYAGALQQLATLHEPLARFFDDVMVMAEDETLRHNRIALLGRVRAMFLRVADLSSLQQSG